MLERARALAGNILYQRSPGSNIQKLDAPTDTKDRQFVPQSPSRQSELYSVALWVNEGQPAGVGTTIMLGSYIATATQEQAIEQAIGLPKQILIGEQW